MAIVLRAHNGHYLRPGKFDVICTRNRRGRPSSDGKTHAETSVLF